MNFCCFFITLFSSCTPPNLQRKMPALPKKFNFPLFERRRSKRVLLLFNAFALKVEEISENSPWGYSVTRRVASLANTSGVHLNIRERCKVKFVKIWMREELWFLLQSVSGYTACAINLSCPRVFIREKFCNRDKIWNQGFFSVLSVN